MAVKNVTRLGMLGSRVPAGSSSLVPCEGVGRQGSFAGAGTVRTTLVEPLRGNTRLPLRRCMLPSGMVTKNA